MHEYKVALAVDLGASSGRVLAGEFDGDSLRLVEIHRFPTRNVRLRGSCYWDALFIFSEILEGLHKAYASYAERIVSLGVDTWGVDYGWIDADGKLLGNPYQYRDARTDGMRELAASRMDEATIYSQTGIQPMFFNTLYQLLSEASSGSAQMKAAKQLLFMPDLINYWLSGLAVNERTIASTSQMLNPQTGEWAAELLDRMGIAGEALGEIVEPGTTLGPICREVADKIGAGEESCIAVVAVGAHDTASAVAGRPAADGRRAFLSSGTWSLLGMELDEPILTSDALAGGFSNEIGVGGKVLFLTNICGLWLLQECRAQWIKEGEELSFGEMVALATEASPFLSVIDPNDSAFAQEGDMPSKICRYCADTGQAVPETKGQLLRVVTESLAATYRLAWERLQSFSAEPLDSLSVVGGDCLKDSLIASWNGSRELDGRY